MPELTPCVRSGGGNVTRPNKSTIELQFFQIDFWEIVFLFRSRPLRSCASCLTNDPNSLASYLTSLVTPEYHQHTAHDGFTMGHTTALMDVHAIVIQMELSD